MTTGKQLRKTAESKHVVLGLCEWTHRQYVAKLQPLKLLRAKLRDVFVQTVLSYDSNEYKTVQQWRRHGMDWGGHVHSTFARGRS